MAALVRHLTPTLWNIASCSGVRRKKFRGVQDYGWSRRDRGESPRTPENFRKFGKNFVRKLQKLHYFSILFNTFKIPALHFSAFGRKTQFAVEILRRFWKSLMKIQ